MHTFQEHYSESSALLTRFDFRFVVTFATTTFSILTTLRVTFFVETLTDLLGETSVSGSMNLAEVVGFFDFDFPKYGEVCFERQRHVARRKIG